jgi:ketosteroid isomerase-like protein
MKADHLNSRTGKGSRLAWSRLGVMLAGVIGILAPSVASHAQSSDSVDVQATVEKWVAHFNSGDIKAFVAGCDSNAAVIDGFPPYSWTSCAEWMAAYAANSKSIRLTDGHLSISEPVSSFPAPGLAYLVYPAKFTDQEDGKPVAYIGTWTITLRKAGNRWLVTGSGSNWGGNYSVRSDQ